VSVSGFTSNDDWLAFTVPDAAMDDVIRLIGGDWFKSERFRGYPVAHLMTKGATASANWNGRPSQTP
jgi:hypothetical protein